MTIKTFVQRIITSLVVLSSALLPATTWAAFDWTERQPDESITTYDGPVASDADGSNLIVGSGLTSGRLYTSSDGGANWTERQPAGDVAVGWRSVASDSDGSHLFVASYTNGRLYTSSDGGENWTERQPAGDVSIFWYSVASDADGSNLIASVYSGRLYTSSDGGANWTERQPAGATNKFWQAVASDDDGSNLIAAVGGYAGSGRLYTSSDGGANWTERQPSGNFDRRWEAVASDDDGSNLIAAVGGLSGTGRRLYTSSDGGANWTERQPAGASNRAWAAVSSDADGSHLFAAVSAASFAGLYLSIDGGVSWVLDEPDGVSSSIRSAVSLSGDGSRAIVSAGNLLYTGGPDMTAPTISTLSPADDATDVAVDTDLVITFNETVAASSTGNVVIYDASDDSVVATIPADDAQVTVNDDEVTVNPTADLTEGADYYIQIDDGAFEDAAGNPFAGIDDETTWSFTTIPPDETAPTISSLDPEDDATGVATNYLANSGATIEFDETIVVGTGTVTIYDASDDSVVAVYDVEDENYVTVEDEYAYIYTEEEEVLLEGGTTHYILIDEGAFEDESGNPFAGIADETTWNFATQLNPTVIIDEDFVTGDGFLTLEDDSYIETLTVQDDGKVIVGGYFNIYDNDSIGFGIARLNTDGTRDETFDTGDGFDDSVGVIVDTDGKILVGGQFTMYDGATSTYIARLNTDGSLDDTFVTGDGFSGSVRDIAVQDDGKIIVIGNFDGYNGSGTGNGIARLNTDGTIDEDFVANVTNGPFDNYVHALAIQDDGKIVVGGYFDGYTRFGLARLNTSGSLDETFVTGDGFDDDVVSIAIDTDGKILLMGEFSDYDGSTANTIVRLNSDGSLDETFDAGDGFLYEGGSGYLYEVAIDEEGNILLVGYFDEYDGTSVGYGIARLNTDGTLDDTFTTGNGFGSDGELYALALQDDGKILAGGYFDSYDGDEIGFGIARLIPPSDDEEEPGDDDDDEEEEEEEPSSNRGSSSSHRRSSGAGTSSDVRAESIEALMQQVIVLLTQLLEQLIAEQGN